MNNEKINKILICIGFILILVMLLMPITFSSSNDFYNNRRHDVYNKGFKAGEVGATAESNPYSHFTAKQAEIWMDGWIDGVENSKNEKKK